MASNKKARFPNHGDEYKFQQLSKKLIAQSDGYCSICGRELLMKNDPNYSPYHPASVSIDHIQPISRGGAPLDPENLAVVCRQCNMKKKNKPIEVVMKEQQSESDLNLTSWLEW